MPILKMHEGGTLWGGGHQMPILKMDEGGTHFDITHTRLNEVSRDRLSTFSSIFMKGAFIKA